MTKSKTDTVTVDLPSGKTAEIRTAKGRDLIQAHRLAKGGEPIELTIGLIAATTIIDGQSLTYEDYMDMGIADVNRLIHEISGEGGKDESGFAVNAS